MQPDRRACARDVTASQGGTASRSTRRVMLGAIDLDFKNPALMVATYECSRARSARSRADRCRPTARQSWLTSKFCNPVPGFGKCRLGPRLCLETRPHSKQAQTGTPSRERPDQTS